MIIDSPIISGSLLLTGSLTHVGDAAHTGSFNLSGSLSTIGTITATTLVVQTITSSISSITGSTKFGALPINTHQFTGSVNITGSLAVTTIGTEFQVLNTGVNLGNALTDSHVISGSVTMNPGGLFVSSSGNTAIGSTTATSRFSVGNKLLMWDSQPTGAVATTTMGYLFNSSKPTAGLIVEDAGASEGLILTYAANVSQVGTRNNSFVGGFFRIDTRAGNQEFSTYGVPTGGTSEFARIQVNLQNGNTLLAPQAGNVGIGISAFGTMGSKLQINGNAAIGYSTSTAAPTNGLAVSGNIATGTTNNPYRLTVALNAGAGYIGVTNQNGAVGDRMLRMGFNTGHTYATIQGTRLNTADDVNIAIQADGGNLGVGTSTIGSKVQVNGNAAIGYSASTAAPSNGLAVSGSVGIGTITPARLLHLSSSSDVYMQVDRGSITSLFGTDNVGTYIGQQGAFDLRLITNTIERIRITSAGQFVTSYGQTGGYNRTDSGYVNETINITANCTAYFLYKYSGDGNGSSFTNFNITGVSTTNGTWLDICIRARKDATGSAINTTAVFQINGSTIDSIAASGTGAQQRDKTLRVVRMSDEWIVVGTPYTV